MVLGIDEVGRGAVAGPVCVGGVLVLDVEGVFGFCEENGLRDSKKLSEAKREWWFEVVNGWANEGLVRCHAELVDVECINKNGIVEALRIGVDGVIEKLSVDGVLCNVDYGLGFGRDRVFEHKKGDENFVEIGLASIYAKVVRDRYMCLLGGKYPEYGFERNKGYGTKEHGEAICRVGMIDGVHRVDFCSRWV